MDVLVSAPVPGRSVALALLLGFSACVPDLDVDESVVDEPRVLAIQAVPAEAAPDQPVTYRALYVDRGGTRSEGDLTWYFCTAPKPLAELGPIHRSCLTGEDDSLDEIGPGLETQAALPRQACALFGPNPPPPVEDQPPGRPVDPDQTGGYKLPVMLGVDAGGGQDILLYEQRIACGLAGVTPQTSIEHTQRYHRNENPVVSELEVTRASGVKQVVADGQTLEVSPGELLRIAARWPSCPATDACGDGVCGPDESAHTCAADCATPVGCRGAERYLWFDTERRVLSVRRESMRAAWYATAGTLEQERSGVGEQEMGHARRLSPVGDLA
jgi:hypothetical protein